MHSLRRAPAPPCSVRGQRGRTGQGWLGRASLNLREQDSTAGTLALLGSARRCGKARRSGTARVSRTLSRRVRSQYDPPLPPPGSDSAWPPPAWAGTAGARIPKRARTCRCSVPCFNSHPPGQGECGVLAVTVWSGRWSPGRVVQSRQAVY